VIAAIVFVSQPPGGLKPPGGFHQKSLKTLPLVSARVLISLIFLSLKLPIITYLLKCKEIGTLEKRKA
jgi:hypothetical protein